MAKIWGIAPWQGKTIDGSDTRTVMDQYNANEAAKPKSTEYKNTEEALGPPTVGPISLDPTDYIGPGALAKAGAAIKGVLTGGSALMIGAFRSAATTSIPREVAEFAATGVIDIARARRRGPEIIQDIKENSPEMYVRHLIGSKISDKELIKYGDETFLLDPFLDSTRHNGLVRATPFTTEDIVDSETARFIKDMNRYRTEIYHSVVNDNDVVKALKESDGIISREILKRASIVEDYMLAGKKGKTLLDVNKYDASQDIASGINTLKRDMHRHGILAEEIEGKSLQQIVSLVNKKNDELVKILKKSQIAVDRKVNERTLELKYQRPELGDWVELQDLRDLSQETAKMNHCIGAVGRPNDKYLPAMDIVTEELHPTTKKLIEQGLFQNSTSAGNYNAKMGDETSKFFSFRPKGMPEMTIEVDLERSAYGTVVQAFGPEDRDLTPAQVKAFNEFIEKHGYDDATGYKEVRAAAPRGWGQANGPAVAPDNAIGQNANDVNFLNALEDPNRI